MYDFHVFLTFSRWFTHVINIGSAQRWIIKVNCASMKHCIIINIYHDISAYYMHDRRHINMLEDYKYGLFNLLKKISEITLTGSVKFILLDFLIAQWCRHHYICRRTYRNIVGINHEELASELLESRPLTNNWVDLVTTLTRSQRV